jgi:hypothetical protein
MARMASSQTCSVWRQYKNVVKQCQIEDKLLTNFRKYVCSNIHLSKLPSAIICKLAQRFHFKLPVSHDADFFLPEFTQNKRKYYFSLMTTFVHHWNILLSISMMSY